MKLKHLYENHELKKSDYNRQNKEFVLAVDNDDCQIIIRYPVRRKTPSFMAEI